MVGSSKILTVSYGTFSCTLEGFDDPFSTMKSIAEYFRDLAADDRYFGAEPPTPDAEMLHRIAEREVQRRVETRLTSHGITLRQTEEMEEDEVASESTAEVAQRDAEPAVTSGPRAEADHAPQEPIADKLSRIRAVVDRARARSMPSPAAPAFDAEEEVTAPLSEVADNEPVATQAEVAPAYEDTPPLEDTFEEEFAQIEEPAAAGEDTDEEDEVEEIAAESEAEFDEEAEEFEEADHAWADSVDGEDDADEQDDIAARAAEEDDGLADRIVRLSQTGRQSGLLSDEDEENQPEDDETLAGIRMALDAEQAAIAQEKKEQRLERRHVLIGGDPDQGTAFNRILAETDNKLADREGTRRRSAIAHLKAAVAATKADRMLNRERSRQIDEEEQSAYRDDLAKVVRPRPSQARESAAEKARPVSEEAAPLILGSNQRVDEGERADRITSVQPRRVGAGMLALDADNGEQGEREEDDEEFATFAAQMGARELPDLLEAAAAYTAFVERQPHFSRPQIMRRAAAIETEEEFTREAGLRSFGQLLRQGKIRKLQRGQFTISENSRFRPETRIAGE